MFDTVGFLLAEKDDLRLFCVAPSASVLMAVRTMNEENIGAVLIMDQDGLVGIFTERDVMVRVVGYGRDPTATSVSDVMTSAVYSVEPATTVDEALRVMSDRRHRHLPVMEHGQVRGLVSMGDLSRWVIRTQQKQFDGAIRAVKLMAISNRRG